MRNLGWFLSAGLALNLTPGPDMLYVSARSLAQGFRYGLVSALGIATGCLAQTVAVALGLASLLARAPIAYRLIRFSGALYLLYLGVRILTERTLATRQESGDPRTLGAVYIQGLMTNLLNPKVGLFFLAFLPQFVDPTSEIAPLEIFLLGCLFNLCGTTVNVLVALLAGSGGARWSQGPGLGRLGGVVLIGIALGMALASL